MLTKERTTRHMHTPLIYSIFPFSDLHFVYLECINQISRHNFINLTTRALQLLSCARMALYSIFLSFASVCLLFIWGGRLLYEQYYGEQKCEMTYMYLYPQYQVRN